MNETDELIDSVMRQFQLPNDLVQGIGGVYASSHIVAARQQEEQWKSITADSLQQMMWHLSAQIYGGPCACRRCPTYKLAELSKTMTELETMLRGAAKGDDEFDALMVADWLEERGESELSIKLRENPKDGLTVIKAVVLLFDGENDPKLTATPRMQWQ